MNSTLINILQSTPIHSIQHAIQSSVSPLSFLVISFQLILLSTLNHVKLNQTTLFSMTIDKFASQVKAVVANQFDYVLMKYDSKIHLNHLYNNFELQDKMQTYIDIDSYRYEQTGTQNIRIIYFFDKHQQILERNKNSKRTIKFTFGNTILLPKDKSSFQAKFSINNFNFKFQKMQNLRRQIQQQGTIQLLAPNPLKLYNYNLLQGSFPIIYMIAKQNLNVQGQRHFQELIKNTQPYTAIDITGKNTHLFICHDMKGGYKQDIVFHTPIEKSRSNSYRFNYFWHTSIFNYFSHKTISIPPKHWRQQCKKYQVKCLGTFITQPQKILQNYYLTRQFSLKLVYIAKKYKFDGYLLNIEDSVRDMQRFKNWLKDFVNLIHEKIPGSMVSWYDSINTQGVIQYQNAVTQKNKLFYQLTDSFYTNYWWDDTKLQSDIKQSIKNKTIYIGNDVWGRGTYGGGQFDLYTATQKIQSLNNSIFGSALFAPGYTYETGGQNNNGYLQANEERLYRGVDLNKFQLQQWQDIEINRTQYPTLNYQKWQSKFYNDDLWLYKNKGQLKITFLFKLNTSLSSPSISQPIDYKIRIKIRDSSTDQLFAQSLKQERIGDLSRVKDVKFANIYFDTYKMTPKTEIYILKLSNLKDVIIDQTLLISYYQQKQDWIRTTPLTNVNFNSQYNTFFNMGHGSKFYAYGQAAYEHYDFLADYDMPHTMAINHPFSTEINFDDSYFGGSSLRITNLTAKLISYTVPITQQAYAFHYYIKIVQKGCSNLKLSLNQSNGYSINLQKGKQRTYNNGWKQTIFSIQQQNYKKLKKNFFKTFETTLQLFTSSKECLVGQLYLQPSFDAQVVPPTQSKPNLEIYISESHKTKQDNKIVLKFQFQQLIVKQRPQQPNSKKVQNPHKQLSKRYLLQIDDLFSCFIYLDKTKQFYKGFLQQIQLNLDKNKDKLLIKVTDVQSQFEQKLILQEYNINLIQLKTQALDHKIHIKNY